MSSGYRAEIDGLRAVAVIPVIFFHAGFHLFRGGFAGVDVFFVVSGFLITRIIRSELKSGRFSIWQFYERRIRRILPALLLVIVCSTPFAWLWMFPDELEDFGNSQLATLAFVSNFYFWATGVYFGLANELKPLIHTWSLAVEEQFYLLFPLLLVLASRLKDLHLAMLLFATGVASFVLAEFLPSYHSDAVFYLLPTRIWELACGALVAVLPRSGLMTDRWRNAAGLAGLGLLIAVFFWLDPTLPFPGRYALLPVVATCIVIRFATAQTTAGQILGSAPLRGLGLISYGAYLWHQPVLALARTRWLDALTTTQLLTVIALSLVLAAISWKLIEQPFRNRSTVGRPLLFSSLAALTALAAFSGLAFHVGHGYDRRINEAAREQLRWADDKSPYGSKCHADQNNQITPATACRYGSKDGIPIYVWGDSHAVSIAWQLSEVLGPKGYEIVHFTHSACPPLNLKTTQGSCKTFNRATEAFLNNLPKGAIIVIASRWTTGFGAGEFDNQEGGIEPFTGNRLSPPRFVPSDANLKLYGELYRAEIQKLIASGHRVLLVYQVPEVGWNVPQRLAREAQFGVVRSGPLSTSYEVYQRRTGEIHGQLSILPNSPGLIRLRPNRLFCDPDVAQRCYAQRNGVPLYSDDDHLNSAGARLVAKEAERLLAAAGWLNH